ncbi:hypothetical protein T439DRAFT_320035 [Meredithblackwellia eburnea MCA 4105]
MRSTLIFTFFASCLVSSVLAHDNNTTAFLHQRERRGCTRASQCTSQLVKNQIHTCVNHSCHRVCKSGYEASKGQCVKKTVSTSPKTPSSSSSASLSAAAVKSKLMAQGITGFLGTNGPAIASWYRTDNSQDSTNGHSWCGFPYNDNLPGFAPNVKIMLDNFGGSWEKAGAAYCGLEAKVTTPDGRTALLYVADGFDPYWVRTPGSIDVIVGSFSKLFGRTTSNKNDVVQSIKWEFTGNRNPLYVFKGKGSG